jgi:hypothetical protein
MGRGTARAGASAAFVGQRDSELIGATCPKSSLATALAPPHYLNEEWVIALRGEPTLRTPEGEQVLKGDVVCFRGATVHWIFNRTDSPIRVLMLSSMTGGDHRVPCDTGRFSPRTPRRKRHVREAGTTVEYWERELARAALDDRAAGSRVTGPASRNVT